MNLRIGRTAIQRLRISLVLAEAYSRGGRLSAAEVTRRTPLPPFAKSHLLLSLVRSGIAESRAGPTGGYRLARSPAHISLWEVLQGGGFSKVKPSLELGQAGLAIDSAAAAFRHVLSGVSLASLLPAPCLQDQTVSGLPALAPGNERDRAQGQFTPGRHSKDA